jgi:hypothetical protein
MFNERLNFSPDRRITCVMQLNRNSHLCLGALRSWAAFAGLLVLAQFSFRIERFAAHFTLVLTGLLVHDCSS